MSLRVRPPRRLPRVLSRQTVASVGVLAVVAVVASAAAGARDAQTADVGVLREGAVPEPVESALVVAAPRTLPAAATWAPVRRRTTIVASPDGDARPVGRLGIRTPEGTRNLVAVVGPTETDAAGRLWVPVRWPGAPRAASGWIPRGALGGYREVEGRVVIDRERRVLSVVTAGRVVFSAPVGVGRASARTPRGDFYIRSKLTRYRSPFFGPIAFGTSARAPKHTDWPAGGFVGIHGTNDSQSVPGAISRGCIRLRNEDLLRVAELIEVGTPVSIR